MRFHPTKGSIVTSPYGWRTHPIKGERTFHAGTDFRAPEGTPLYATFDGKVYHSKTPSAGNRLELRSKSGGTRVWYLHLSRYATPAGAQVKAGQIIGYAGSTGNVTAAHLHLEVYTSGIRQNPERWLKNAVTELPQPKPLTDWMDDMFKDKNEFRRAVQMAVRAEIERIFQEEKDQRGTPGGINRTDLRKFTIGSVNQSECKCKINEGK